MHIPVLTPAQAAAWDAAASAADRPLRMLMESAGRAVAEAALRRVGAAARQGTLVACGPGNNGGDGWVAARALHLAGVPVWVTESGEPPAGIAADARRDALADGVRTVSPTGPWPGIGLVVDALLGAGAVGAPREPMRELLQRLADLERPVLAVDGPTGLDLTTGTGHSPLVAALTVTFGGARRGHLLAREEIGDLLIAEIGLPAADPAWPRLIDRTWAGRRVAPIDVRSHKGTRGRVVLIGGAPEMVGAIRLTARAAFAAGAGLVHAVVPPASADVLRGAEPDLQVLAHDFDTPPTEALLTLLNRADALAIGPGLGRAPGRAAFVAAVLTVAARAVVDADALIALVGHAALRPLLGRGTTSREILLTPHVGEFRALVPDAASALETDPWHAAAEAAERLGATVLLKGVPTVIVGEGACHTVAAGNPGLATGGSGDVLTGIAATFLAQGFAAADAGALAAQALGEAADHAARRGSARTLRPMDVIGALDDVWRGWAEPGHVSFPFLADLPAPRSV